MLLSFDINRVQCCMLKKMDTKRSTANSASIFLFSILLQNIKTTYRIPIVIYISTYTLSIVPPPPEPKGELPFITNSTIYSIAIHLSSNVITTVNNILLSLFHHNYIDYSIQSHSSVSY